MKKLQFYVLFLIASISLPAVGQNSVTGTVFDEQGETLPGVNVIIKGATTGTITNYDGVYSIQASSADLLEFTFMGYQPKEEKVGNQTTINVNLEETAFQLHELEVVSIGYGVVKRKDLTSSIAKANMSDILKTPVNNIAQALGGRMAGVQVSSKDGGLGDNFNITIRGAGSLTQNTEPLYVIDGFPLEASNMGSLNPKDIASILE